MNLSIVILTKNEAETIGDCLDSLVDLNPSETLVIDDGSTDSTVKNAREKSARVFEYHKKDFADARNYASKEVKGDWILYVDADERVSKELATEIKHKLSKSAAAAYTVPRVNYYLGKKWPYVEKIIRLIKKSALQRWEGEVHESPVIHGATVALTQPLYHYTHRNLKEMVENTLVWSEIEAKLRYNSGHPQISWWRIPRVMLLAFWDYYISQGGWKVGTVGLIESIYQAFSIFITYARLWEMQQNKA